ncbi:MAG TPA: Flp family type IVb pilin [Rhizomicrobium sp.]|jgi:pilus assembly protein Flp/PilA
MGASARSGGRSNAARGFAAYSAFARSHLKAFAANESGATAIEYALLAAMITVGTIAAITSIGTTLSGTFTAVSDGFGK